MRVRRGFSDAQKGAEAAKKSKNRDLRRRYLITKVFKALSWSPPNSPTYGTIISNHKNLVKKVQSLQGIYQLPDSENKKRLKELLGGVESRTKSIYQSAQTAGNAASYLVQAYDANVPFPLGEDNQFSSAINACKSGYQEAGRIITMLNELIKLLGKELATVRAGH